MKVTDYVKSNKGFLAFIGLIILIVCLGILQPKWVTKLIYPNEAITTSAPISNQPTTAPTTPQTKKPGVNKPTQPTAPQPQPNQGEIARLNRELGKKDCENSNLRGQVTAYEKALKNLKKSGNTGNATAPPNTNANTSATVVAKPAGDCTKTITAPLTTTTEVGSGRAPNSFYEDNKIKFCIRIGKSEKVWLPQRLSDINLTSPNAFDNRQGGANWEFLATNGNGPNPNEAVVSTDGTVWVPASWVQQIANMQSIEPIAELNGKMTGWGCQQMALEGDYYVWRYKK